MNDKQNLIALVSTDAEFDYFEAVRESYAANLTAFIAATVRAELAALTKLTATARMSRPRKLAITGATLEDSTGALPVRDSVILIEDGVITGAGRRSRVRIPKDAILLDAAGKYAIPGLWTCTPTMSRWSGDRSTSPPASPVFEMSVMNSISSELCMRS
jgi:hypothetical protein